MKAIWYMLTKYQMAMNVGVFALIVRVPFVLRMVEMKRR